MSTVWGRLMHWLIVEPALKVASESKKDNECQCPRIQIIGKEGFICESTERISAARCQRSQARAFEAR